MCPVQTVCTVKMVYRPVVNSMMITSSFVDLYCPFLIVLHCTTLSCIVLYCPVLYYIVLHCPVLSRVSCTDGMYSEDGLSSGGEFYDDNVEFRRPAPDVVIKSVPIVHSQQASHSLITFSH